MKPKPPIMKFVIICSALLAVMASCDNSHCIRGNKDPISEARTVSSFNGLISKGSFDVTIIESETTEVWVEAESNLLPYISTYVSNNDLIIKVKENRCLQNNTPLHVHVYTPVLDRIKLDGSGNIKGGVLRGSLVRTQVSGSGDIRTGIDAGMVNATVSGSGKIYLQGQADESEMSISGSGDIKAYDLMQNTCFATISGSGNMYVFANELLDVKISGSGNLYYKGNPQVNVRITGSGKVYHTW